MSKKNNRIIIVILISIIFIGGSVAGWLLSRSNTNNTKLGDEVRSLRSLVDSYGKGLSYVTEQYVDSEAGRLELDSRNKELEIEISDIIERFGDLDGGFFDIESEIGAARKGLQSDIRQIHSLATEIRESIEAAEQLQNSDLYISGNNNNSVDPFDSGSD